MLAEASPIGDNVLLFVGPIVFAVAIAVWIAMVFVARRRVRHPERLHGESSHRGPVAGGVLEGDPGQRNRR